ncbi:MAG: glycosyltransferase [Candidatus Sericytochromatia bacterium]|nr:glycosyltransferase [Candidatus Sericytochromatia bacterium]
MAAPLPILLCPACGAPGGAPFCRRGDGENLQTCPRCDTIYRMERPLSLAALYDGVTVLESLDQSLDAARWRLGWMLFACDVLGVSPTPLLDNACGQGAFLALARGFELGPLAGCDLTPRARLVTEVTGQAVPAFDFDDVRLSWEEALNPQVVLAWDLLTSLPQPRDAVLHWANRLGEGGLLLFSIPNADALREQARPEKWPGLQRHYEQLCYVGEAGLEALLGSYFQTRVYRAVRFRGEDILLGVATARELTLQQAELLGSVLEAPAVLREAIRAREIGPAGLLGLGLLEGSLGDAGLAEEAATRAEMAGAAPAPAAFVRALVSLRCNRLEPARVDLAIASQSLRLREASHHVLVTVLERLLHEAQTLGTARMQAAIEAEAQLRQEEARLQELVEAPPGERAPAPASVRLPRRALRRGSWLALLSAWGQALSAKLRRWPRPGTSLAGQRAQRDRLLAPHLGKRVVVVLPGADTQGGMTRWHQLGLALARAGCVVVLVDEAASFEPVGDGLFRANLVLARELRRPWVVVTDPRQLTLLTRFCLARVIYDAPVPPVAPATGPLLEPESGLSLRARRGRGVRARVSEAHLAPPAPWTGERLQAAHHTLLTEASVVLARNGTVWEAAQGGRDDVCLLPDGAELSDWQGEGLPPPKELRPLVGANRPLAGYVGPVGQGLSLDLLVAVAGRLPHWAFVLIGPIGKVPLDSLPVNIYLLGERPLGELPAYVQAFSVAMFPVAPEPMLHGFAAPGLMACLAAGKPVVSTPFPDAAGYRGLRTAEDAEGFAAALEVSRASIGLPAARAVRTQDAEQVDWGRRLVPLLARWATLERLPTDVAVVLSRTPWLASASDHRAAQFARAWRSAGWHVVFAQWGELASADGGSLARPGISVLRMAEFDLVGHVSQPPNGRYVAMISSPHPAFEPAIEAMQAAGADLIYDMVEDEDAFREDVTVDLGVEARLAGLADVLTAPTVGAAAVLEARCGRTVHPVPDGLDRERFDRKRRWGRPGDLPSGKPLFVYVGALWDTVFDWAIVERVLQAYPSGHVVLVGDYTDQCPFRPPSHLHILGSRPHASIPAYLAAADVVLMPLTLAPGRPEPRPGEVLGALALGRPVVATAYGERTSWPGLHLAPDADAFVAAISRALSHPVEPAVSEALARINSWEHRLESLLELLSPPVASVLEEPGEPLDAAPVGSTEFDPADLLASPVEAWQTSSLATASDAALPADDFETLSANAPASLASDLRAALPETSLADDLAPAGPEALLASELSAALPETSPADDLAPDGPEGSLASDPSAALPEALGAGDLALGSDTSMPLDPAVTPSPAESAPGPSA